MSTQSKLAIHFDSAVATTLGLGTLTKEANKYRFCPKPDYKNLFGTVAILSSDLYNLILLVFSIYTQRDITTIEFI